MRCPRQPGEHHVAHIPKTRVAQLPTYQQPTRFSKDAHCPHDWAERHPRVLNHLFINYQLSIIKPNETMGW